MHKTLSTKKKRGIEVVSPIERKTNQQLNIFGLAELLNKTPLSLYLLVKTKQVHYERVNKQPMLSLSMIEEFFLSKTTQKITNC